jgi:hypothetical protein
MAKDLSAVGNAASASKSETGLSGDEVFNGKVSLDHSDNGGFILDVCYTKKQKGGKRGQDMMSYCPDKHLTFATLDEVKDVLDDLYGPDTDAAIENDEPKAKA